MNITENDDLELPQLYEPTMQHLLGVWVL